MTGSVTEHLEATLARIAEHNARLRIVTALDESGARKAAAASDARHRAGGTLGPLDGMLLGVKDNIAVNGLPWTAGLGARKKTAAGKDAISVAKLRAAGAIPFAMLNMHEAALGATTNNPHFGRCLNPLDETRTPGGSSGGSGAAIAADFCDIALGTDTMGSVRIPAAYCGVVGLKPTKGLVDLEGLVFLAPSLDMIGPLARDVETVRQMIQVMSGRNVVNDRIVANSSQQTVGAAQIIGIPKQIGDVDCQPAVLEGLQKAVRTFETSGIRVIDVDLPDWEPGRARRGGLLVSENEGAAELKPVLDVEDENLMSAELRRLLIYGRDASPEKLRDARARIRVAATACEDALAEADLIMMPTAPQLPFRHEEPIPANQADLTSLASFHGGPALSLPVPGPPLPPSIQLVGAMHSEPMVLEAARMLEGRLAI